MELFVFICASLMVLGGAVGVVVRAHPVHAALSLVLTLFGVAVLFVAQDAHFLAAVQVIVYAGAIVVLFLFVIMLLGVHELENMHVEPFRVQRPLAVISGLGFVGVIVAAVVSARDVPVQPVKTAAAVKAANELSDSNVRSLARDLFSDHVLAFELTSVLLVIAVVGTVILTRRPPRAEAPTKDRAS